MFLMSGPSEIMQADETLKMRRLDNTLGEGVIIIDGKRVNRGYQEFSIEANVQPIAGDDLLLVPEGDRFDEALWIYVPSTSEQPQANDLVYREDWYQVQAAETWGSYCKARIQRVDVGPDRAIGV